MTDTGKGYLILIGALGMLFTLLSVEIGALNSWAEATTPKFVGMFLGHVGAVIVAFMGGKKVPTE